MKDVGMSAHGHTIAVFGAEGMAGTAIVSHLNKSNAVLVLPRSAFEIGTDRLDELDLGDCKYVVNAAGMINRPMREAFPASVFEAVNARFPLELSKKCQREDRRLIHISTDCVFAGHTGCYVETSLTDGTGLYSETKQAGEPESALVLRMSMVGPETRNFYSLLCWFLAQPNRCKGYTDHIWNGLTTPTVGAAIERIILDDLYVEGVRHVFSQDVSKNELLAWFRDAYALKTEIEPVRSGTPRDMRLRTAYPDFLSALSLPLLKEQVAGLPALSTPQGHWKDW